MNQHDPIHSDPIFHFHHWPLFYFIHFPAMAGKSASADGGDAMAYGPIEIYALGRKFQYDGFHGEALLGLDVWDKVNGHMYCIGWGAWAHAHTSICDGL